jgi:hypothetical protein
VSDSRIVENRREGFYLWDEYQYSYRLEAVSVTNSDLSGNGTEARSRLADETTTVKSSTANYTIEDVYTTPVTAPDAGTLTLVQVDYDETDYSPGMTVYGYLMLGAEGTTSIRTIDGDAKNYWIEVPAGVTTVRGKINDRYQPSYATFTFTKLLYHAPVAAVPDPVEVVTGAMNCAPQFQSNWWGTTDPTGILARITNVGYAPNTSTPLAAPPVGAGVQP